LEVVKQGRGSGAAFRERAFAADLGKRREKRFAMECANKKKKVNGGVEGKGGERGEEGWRGGGG